VVAHHRIGRYINAEKGTQAQNPVHHPLPAMIEILPAVGIITTQKSTTNTAGNDVIPGRIL
jgi:hypothetical protein